MIRDITPLQDSDLFGTLAQEELTRLMPLCPSFVAIEDSAIFTEGRAALHLYLVNEGQIALQKAIRVPHAKRSRRTTITVCRPGDIFGWSALVEEREVSSAGLKARVPEYADVMVGLLYQGNI